MKQTELSKLFNSWEVVDETKKTKILQEVEELFKKYQENKDVDNLKILKNKVEVILLTNKWFSELSKIFWDIDNEINDIHKSTECEKTWDNELIEEMLKDRMKSFYRDKKDVLEEDLEKYKEVLVSKKNIKYEKELLRLQVELLKLQNHIKKTWDKLLIIFEWRDAAWKGWTIKRFTEHLNPRGARVVALEKPTEQDRSTWFFKRYVNHLPIGWEIVFFDRSWYNRAWVEPVMWFCTKEKYDKFLKEVPELEKMFTNSWIKIIKFYFTVSKEEQAKRFESRKKDLLKQFKLSPVDQESQNLWDKYTLAEYNNFKNTHTDYCPWVIVHSDNKKKARLNSIKYVLSQFNYEWKNEELLKYDEEIIEMWDKRAKDLEKELKRWVDLFKK